jgi:hypothetical protein
MKDIAQLTVVSQRAAMRMAIVIGLGAAGLLGELCTISRERQTGNDQPQ